MIFVFYVATLDQESVPFVGVGDDFSRRVVYFAIKGLNFSL